MSDKWENYRVWVYLQQYGYTLEAEHRLLYMTGFTGSAGMAVVTDTQQALWTDGRYFLQADSELDCNWLLMKKGQDGVSFIIQYSTVLHILSRSVCKLINFVFLFFYKVLYCNVVFGF